MTEIRPHFDYRFLPAADRAMVKTRADEIRQCLKRTAQDILEVGVRLTQVKARLPHGMFGDWLKHEFDWSERTAQRFMSVASAFKSVTVSDLDIQPRALYLLAAPSTPDAARLSAIERASDGERISYGRAKAIVATHSEPQHAPFTIRSQPTALNPIPPEPETIDATQAAFGGWIDRISDEGVTFQNLRRASELAGMLTPSQQARLSELIDFLQGVERFYNARDARREPDLNF